MTNADDIRFMAASLRHARRHRSQTGTNPSVGTLLVKNNRVVGRGITARGGRPHAERMAIDSCSDDLNGATAYVSLEPCAHHGATPPCARALIDAGVSRVVTAWTDPDNRVDGKGHAMLREAGIGVTTGILDNMAAADLAGYLIQKQNNRPQVTLKLAASSDGMLGRHGEETLITGPLARAMVHRIRAEHQAILVGRGTVDADDPELTCRLPGLAHRSPQRFVLDTNAGLASTSSLANSAKQVPVSLVTSADKLSDELLRAGVRRFAAETSGGRLALPEVLEDMANAGISSLMVEGGAQTANSFLDAGLVDEIALFSSTKTVGKGGIVSPIAANSFPPQFTLVRCLKLGDDILEIARRI